MRLFRIWLLALAPASAAAQTAVVELFTSQGCSSCPPADALLARLAERPEVLALSFHVDYWDYLGWRDPYADPAFAERQRAYARALKDRVYTPQAIVNGAASLVGSRESQLRAAIATASATPLPTSIRIVDAARDGGDLEAEIALDGAIEGRTLHAALVEPTAENAVKAGENRGRRLRHANVVRLFQSKPARKTSQWRVAIPKDLRDKSLLLAIYVQNTESLVIEGAAAKALAP